MSDTTQHDVIDATLLNSWRQGYQEAVDKLRWMADNLKDPDAIEVVRMLATTLETMKL